MHRKEREPTESGFFAKAINFPSGSALTIYFTWADYPDGLVPYNLPVRVDSDGNFIWREIGALSPKKKPGTKKGAKKSASKKQGTKKGGNQHHRPGCNCVTCPRMRANQEKNDGDNEESPHQSPHQSPLKTPPFRVGGGDRTPPKGNGGRKEPEEDKVNRKHGAGCQCQECVPPAKHGEGCMCPTCDPPHGKGCMCERWQCQQAAAAAVNPPAARQTAASVVIRMAIMAPPLNAYFMARAACAPTVILIGGAVSVRGAGGQRRYFRTPPAANALFALRNSSEIETVASGVSGMTTTGMAVAAAVGMAVAAAIMACTAITEASSCLEFGSRTFAAADKRIFGAGAAAGHFFHQLHCLPLGLAGRVAVWRLVRWHGVPSAPIAQAA
eukprot:g33526.t1